MVIERSRALWEIDSRARGADGHANSFIDDIAIEPRWHHQLGLWRVRDRILLDTPRYSFPTIQNPDLKVAFCDPNVGIRL